MKRWIGDLIRKWKKSYDRSAQLTSIRAGLREAHDDVGATKFFLGKLQQGHEPRGEEERITASITYF